MMELLLGAFPVIVALAMILHLARGSSRSLKEVRRLALRHGLNLRDGEGPGTFLANGSVDGRTVFFQSRWVRTGNQRHIQTELLVDIKAPLPGRLSLSPEGLATPMLKWMGEQDIQVGDPRLDKALLIQGHEPEVRGLLRDAALRKALLAWFSRYPTGRIHDGQVAVRLQGSAAGKVEAMMRDAVALAELLAQTVGRQGGGEAPPPQGSLPVNLALPARQPEALLSRWRVAAGQAVNAGEPLCDLMSGQGVNEVLAPFSGEVLGPLRPLGEALRDGAVLLHLRPDGTPTTTAPAPLAPTPAAPVAASTPQVAAPEAPPDADPALLHRLYAARHDRLPREAALQAATGRRFRLLLEIREVAWTSGLFLPPGIQGGRTASGTLQGTETEVAVRFPASHNPELDALGRAQQRPRLLPVQARLQQWDELYRRPLLDADPSG